MVQRLLGRRQGHQPDTLVSADHIFAGFAWNLVVAADGFVGISWKVVLPLPGREQEVLVQESTPAAAAGRAAFTNPGAAGAAGASRLDGNLLLSSLGVGLLSVCPEVAVTFSITSCWLERVEGRRRPSQAALLLEAAGVRLLEQPPEGQPLLYSWRKARAETGVESAASEVEVLPKDASPYEILQVNDFATRLVGNTIKGDAVLLSGAIAVSEQSEEQMLEALLHSKMFRMAQPNCPQNRRRRQASTASVPRELSPAQDVAGHGSLQAVLKRARSFHHIAAANSARQRILSSKSAIQPDSPPAEKWPSVAATGGQATHVEHGASGKEGGSSARNYQQQQQSQSPLVCSHLKEGGIHTDTYTYTPCSSGAASTPITHTFAQWGDLSVEVVARVARLLGRLVSDVMPMYLTCSSWRRGILEDDQLLHQLLFQLDVSRPFKGHTVMQLQTPAASSQQLRLMTASGQHPALLVRAAKLGNVTALVSSARLLDASGCAEEAMRCWRRAAKAGHLEGQLLYGLALYRGNAGLPQDAEDAYMWLLRALKQGQSSAAGGHVVDPALRSRVLAESGLCLGYLVFDGEGVKADRSEAVRYFRLAAGAGCKEAEQVLGWMYNTGQF
eukprot:gene7914-8110_t